MTLLTRRRFLALLGAAFGLAACGTHRKAAPSTTIPPAPTSSPPSSTSPTTSTAAPTTTTTAPTTTSAPSVAAGIDVICKEGWGALPVAGEFTTHTIDRITVHHTAVTLEDNTMAPARLRQHQEFHQSRGWPDLAYHFMIDAAGNVYEGRPVSAVGDTGTNYDPTGHLLICCEGNFDEQDLPVTQYEKLVKMVAWGAARYQIDPAAVQGHRDVAATSCPGAALYAMVADGTLGRAAAAAMGGPIGLVTVCGTAATELVAAIEA